MRGLWVGVRNYCQAGGSRGAVTSERMGQMPHMCEDSQTLGTFCNLNNNDENISGVRVQKNGSLTYTIPAIETDIKSSFIIYHLFIVY